MTEGTLLYCDPFVFKNGATPILSGYKKSFLGGVNIICTFADAIQKL